MPISREEFEDMKADLPDGMSYEDFLDDPASGIMDTPQSGDSPDDASLNEHYLNDALKLVHTRSPVNIKDFGYRGDLDENWAYTISVHRESETVDQSNFEVVERDMETRFPDDVVVERSSHPMVGWIDQLAVRVMDRGYVTDAGVAILDWLSKLEDYPVADEDHWSEKQYELAGQYIDEDIKEIIRSNDDFDEIGQKEVDAIYKWMRENANHALDYVYEHPEQNGLEGNYNDEVEEGAHELGLDIFSRNLPQIKKMLTDLIVRQNMSADQAATEVLDSLESGYGDLTEDSVVELADQIDKSGDPRQQGLPLGASTRSAAKVRKLRSLLRKAKAELQQVGQRAEQRVVRRATPYGSGDAYGSGSAGDAYADELYRAIEPYVQGKTFYVQYSPRLGASIMISFASAPEGAPNLDVDNATHRLQLRIYNPRGSSNEEWNDAVPEVLRLNVFRLGYPGKLKPRGMKAGSPDKILRSLTNWFKKNGGAMRDERQ